MVAKKRNTKKITPAALSEVRFLELLNQSQSVLLTEVKEHVNKEILASENRIIQKVGEQFVAQSEQFNEFTKHVGAVVESEMQDKSQGLIGDNVQLNDRVKVLEGKVHRLEMSAIVMGKKELAKTN